MDEVVRICEAPIALVSLVDEQRQWFKAKVGLQANQTPHNHNPCVSRWPAKPWHAIRTCASYSPRATPRALPPPPDLPGSLVNKPYRKADLLSALA